MKSTKLILASLTAAASFGALALASQAQAQEQTYQRGNAPATYTRAQVYGNSADMSAGGSSSSYGGTSAGRCVGPNSFCNTYFGG